MWQGLADTPEQEFWQQIELIYIFVFSVESGTALYANPTHQSALSLLGPADT